MKLSRGQLIVNAVFCLTLLGVIIWALFAEYDRPWKQYQKEFSRLNSSSATKHKEQIKQLWLTELGETDRCITCHQGADNQKFVDAPQPFRTHSGDYLKIHPVEKFGCAICHEGQGAALTVSAAHGQTDNWNRPLLKGRMAEASCTKCHPIDSTTPSGSKLASASTFSYGRKLFLENNCTGCHVLSGYKRPDYIAPSLSSLGNKVSREWLAKWLKDPKAYLSKTKMPQFTLNDIEIKYISAYLLDLKTTEPCSDKSCIVTANAATIKDGKNLVADLGCLGCHTINSKGNNFGPDLSFIGDKVNGPWLIKWLKAPEPSSPMPDLKLTDREARNITAYLMTLKTPSSIPPLGRGELTFPHKGKADNLQVYIENGKKLVTYLGCTGCHEIEKLPSVYDAPGLDNIGNKRVDELVFTNITGTEKTLLNWLRIKVTDPHRFATEKIITKMPKYDLNEEQAEALVVFLRSLQMAQVPQTYTKQLVSPDDPVTAGQMVIEKYNCTGCHVINGSGGNTGPDLTAEAKKSRPEWLAGFLKKPYKIRTPQILMAKMPDFGLSDKETNSTINYLASLSGEVYPYYSAQKKEIAPEDIWDGEKLYQEIFACSACHRIDGRGGEVGPDHTDLSSRLKRDWIEKWLRDPKAIKPDVIMPGFEFKDWEFEAITNYLMTLGKYRFVTVRSSE